MATVRKRNRVLKVNDNVVSRYLKDGYDQIDEKGEVVKLATGGKSVSIGSYNKVVEEVEKLKAEIKKLKTENTKLKKD